MLPSLVIMQVVHLLADQGVWGLGFCRNHERPTGGVHLDLLRNSGCTSIALILFNSPLLGLQLAHKPWSNLLESGEIPQSSDRPAAAWFETNDSASCSLIIQGQPSCRDTTLHDACFLSLGSLTLKPG